MRVVDTDNRLIIFVTFLFGAAAGCWLRGWHHARRHPLGGQICQKCHAPLRDLEEAGFGDDQLHDARPKFDRINNSFTRQSGF